jgi:hypothetical protein
MSPWKSRGNRQPVYNLAHCSTIGHSDPYSADSSCPLHLDWETIMELEKQYLATQLARAGTPRPKVIGIDEISIRKGHTYRIVVSDLLRRPVITKTGRRRARMTATSMPSSTVSERGPKEIESPDSSLTATDEFLINAAFSSLSNPLGANRQRHTQQDGPAGERAASLPVSMRTE